MPLITSRPKIKTTVDGSPLAYQLFTEGNYVPLVVEVERTTITDDLTDTVVVFSASGGNGEYYISKTSEYPSQVSLISITADRIKALVKLVKEDTLFYLDDVTNFRYSVGLRSDLGLMELESGYFNVNPSLALGKDSQAQIPDSPPLIELTAPKADDKLYVNKPFKLMAKASDTGGGINKVDFYANDIKIGTNNSYSTKGIWDFRYTPTQAGAVIFYAIATDTTQNTTKSNAVAVTVEAEPIQPTANFSFSPLTGGAPLNVTFINNSVNASTYLWNFGDGSATSTAIAPTHIYQTSGNYTITLTATNQYGSSQITKNISVTVATNQAPTVTITNPANNSSVVTGQQVALTATAADADGSVATVQFKVNNVNQGSAPPAAPFTTSFTPSTAGTYTIVAVATDNLGLSTTSAAVTLTVTVPAGQAPTVSITSPTNNASLVTGQAVTITATANDADGTIASVQFRVNGVNLNAPDTTAPYSTTWTPTVDGTYTLTAVATDNSSLTTTSAVITVTATTPSVPLPTVTVTAPKAGLINEAQTLAATASVTGDTLASVQFKIDTVNQGTADTSAPYSIQWTPTTKGSYSITAVALGALGGSTTSTAVVVPIYDTKVTTEGAGTSLAANTGDYVLFDNNQAAGGLPASADLFVGSTQVGVLNYSSDAYNSRPFAFFRASESKMYTGTISSGSVTLNG